MAQFSAKERLVARLLSSTPMLKKWIKKSYIRINSIIYHKNYKSQILIDSIPVINLIAPINPDNETFFGYYDKSPENDDGMIIYNESQRLTCKEPSPIIPMYISAVKREDIINISSTLCYNWQQGCRAQWINSNKICYNYFDGEGYKCVVHDIKNKDNNRVYKYPVQDSFGESYFLSINYCRVMRLRPDYGYRNLPELNDEELKCVDNDGVIKIDYDSGDSQLVVSFSELIKISPKETFEDAFHKVNHVMISPDGKKFIFIHRWYEKGRRHDRLLLSDFGSLKILSDDDMVSHMCWINDSELFGYLRHDGIDGFYFIDIDDMRFTPCDALNVLKNGDGHPSCHGEWIVVDTYPDKSRMQHLYLYNRQTSEVHHLLEVYQSVKFYSESRCDLHPRFSSDGSRIYFDTVFTGKRRLAYIDISSIIH